MFNLKYIDISIYTGKLTEDVDDDGQEQLTLFSFFQGLKAMIKDPGVQRGEEVAVEWVGWRILDEYNYFSRFDQRLRNWITKGNPE